MKGGGTEWGPEIVVAGILLLIAVTFVWAFWTGPPEEDSVEETTLQDCKIDDDCIDDRDGSRCGMIHPGEFELSCGCVKNEDCQYGRNICGPQDKCV